MDQYVSRHPLNGAPAKVSSKVADLVGRFHRVCVWETDDRRRLEKLEEIYGQMMELRFDRSEIRHLLRASFPGEQMCGVAVLYRVLSAMDVPEFSTQGREFFDFLEDVMCDLTEILDALMTFVIAKIITVFERIFELDGFAEEDFDVVW